MKVNPREKGAASHLSCVGWFSRALAFRSLYYPWAKMGTTRGLIRRAGVVQWWEHSLPPMWPGFKSRRRHHMWVEFVVGSLRCSERFLSGHSGFPLSLKTNISNNLIWNSWTRFNEFLWTPKCSVGKQTTNYNLQQIHHNKEMHVSSLPSFHIIVRSSCDAEGHRWFKSTFTGWPVL